MQHKCVLIRGRYAVIRGCSSIFFIFHSLPPLIDGIVINFWCPKKEIPINLMIWLRCPSTIPHYFTSLFKSTEFNLKFEIALIAFDHHPSSVIIICESFLLLFPLYFSFVSINKKYFHRWAMMICGCQQHLQVSTCISLKHFFLFCRFLIFWLI